MIHSDPLTLEEQTDAWKVQEKRLVQGFTVTTSWEGPPIFGVPLTLGFSPLVSIPLPAYCTHTHRVTHSTQSHANTPHTHTLTQIFTNTHTYHTLVCSHTDIHTTPRYSYRHIDTPHVRAHTQMFTQTRALRHTTHTNTYIHITHSRQMHTTHTDIHTQTHTYTHTHRYIYPGILTHMDTHTHYLACFPTAHALVGIPAPPTSEDQGLLALPPPTLRTSHRRPIRSWPVLWASAALPETLCEPECSCPRAFLRSLISGYLPICSTSLIFLWWLGRKCELARGYLGG